MMETAANMPILTCDNQNVSQAGSADSASDALVKLTPEPAGASDLACAADAAREYIEQAKAPNTVRAYRNDWRDFCAWCQGRGLPSLPATPDVVVLYLSDLAATHKVATLTRRISAISQAHQMAGQESPTTTAAVRTVMAGIRRAKGTAANAKTPTLTNDTREMVDTLDNDLLGIRDRALLLVGFAGAFRRSELVGLDRADVEIAHEGLIVMLRRSKTDQDGAGRKVAIPYGANPATCPVRALQAWLEASGITEGPVFRSVNRHG